MPVQQQHPYAGQYQPFVRKAVASDEEDQPEFSGKVE